MRVSMLIIAFVLVYYIGKVLGLMEQFDTMQGSKYVKSIVVVFIPILEVSFLIYMFKTHTIKETLQYLMLFVICPEMSLAFLLIINRYAKQMQKQKQKKQKTHVSLYKAQNRVYSRALFSASSNVFSDFVVSTLPSVSKMF